MRSAIVIAALLMGSLRIIADPFAPDARGVTNNATFLLPVVKAVLSGSCIADHSDKGNRRWIEMGIERLGNYLCKTHTNTLSVVYKSSQTNEEYYVYNQTHSNLMPVSSQPNVRALRILKCGDGSQGLLIIYGLERLTLQVNMNEPEEKRIKAVDYELAD